MYFICFKYPRYHRLGPSCRKGPRTPGKSRRDSLSCKGVGNRTAAPFPPDKPSVSNGEQRRRRRRRPVAAVATRHENAPETLLIKDGDRKRKTQANRAGKGLCVDRDGDNFHIIHIIYIIALHIADFCLWPSDGPLSLCPRPSLSPAPRGLRACPPTGRLSHSISITQTLAPCRPITVTAVIACGIRKIPPPEQYTHIYIYLYM